MSQIQISPYLRKGLSSYIEDEDNLDGKSYSGKERGTINVTLDLKGYSQEQPEGVMTSVNRSMTLYGPSDIVGINSSVIRNVVPLMQTTPMSKDFMPYIEFFEADFPWRYTPLKANNNKLRPWIILVACKEDEYKLTSIDGIQYVEILSDNILPDVESISYSAHVHSEKQNNEDYSFSRLLCLRPLEEETKYKVFLIPSFEQGRLQKSEGIDIQTCSWNTIREGTQTINKPNGEFPVYYTWEFISGKANFETLANKIDPIRTTAPEYKKLRDILRINMLETGLNIPSELTGVKLTNNAWEVADDFRQEQTIEPKEDSIVLDDYGVLPISVALKKEDEKKVSIDKNTKKLIETQQKELKNLLLKSPVFKENEVNKGESTDILDNEDPWVVPPVYGGRQFLSSMRDLDSNTLVKELNLDFENRIAAGLGATVVQDNQEEFVNRAWQQVEDINNKNQIIRELSQMHQLNEISQRRLSKRRKISLKCSKALNTDVAIKVANHYKYVNGNPVEVFFDENSNETQAELSDIIKTAVSDDDFDNEQGITIAELSELLSKNFILENKDNFTDCLVANKLSKNNFFYLYPELLPLKKYFYLKDEEDTLRLEFGSISSPKKISLYGLANEIYKTIKNDYKKRKLSIFEVRYLYNFFKVHNCLKTHGTSMGSYISPIVVNVGNDYGIFLKKHKFDLFTKGKGEWVAYITYGEGRKFYIFNYDHANTKTEFKFSMSGTDLKLIKMNGEYYFEGQSSPFNFSLDDLKMHISEKLWGSEIESYYEKIKKCWWFPTNATIDPSKVKKPLEITFDFKFSNLQTFAKNSNDQLTTLVKKLNEYNQNVQTISTPNSIVVQPETSYTEEYMKQKLETLVKEFYPNREVDLMKLATSKYPIMAYPEYPDPTYFYLRELSEKFILPSVDSIEANKVLCFMSNPKFEEAFLAGMNTEMGRELLWREFPTDERGSYFRKFWDVDEIPEKFTEDYFDTEEMQNWNNSLGNNHIRNESLVVFVIKAELMRTYPETAINIAYFQEGQFMVDEALSPQMSGWLNDDTFMVGFYENDIKKYVSTKAKEDTVISLVFYEQLQNLRFSNKDRNGYDSSAAYAVDTKVNPTIFGLPLSSIKQI